MDHSYDNVTPRIGDAVPRKEDLRLLTGAGSFSDDVNLDGQVYAVMVRSPHAHARIIDVEIAEALAVPGVLAVFTGADAMEDGLAPVPHLVRLGASMDIMLENRDGSEHHRTPHFVLPADKARFVGEALVMVIGETEAAARDGAEQVSIEYEPLPSVTGTAAALTDGAPLVWDDEAATNLCVDADVGDEAATDAAFAGAAHVVRLETWIRRVTGVTMAVITVSFGVTGYSLPWDQVGYWAVKIVSGVPAAIPVVGDFMVELLRGGESVGQATLTRFYSLHTFVMPWLLAVFMLMHFLMIRKQGISGPL